MFHNIFSKTKENQDKKQENKIPIIVDTREKQSLVASFLAEQKANIKFEHLEIADYLIEAQQTIAIERKTFNDFISSMINKRLFQQLNDLKKYENPILIIEGKQETENKNLNKAANSLILSIITEYKIPIIFSENEKQTAEILILLAEKQEKPKQELAIRQSKTFKNLQEQKQFILEGFPGIGPTITKKLLEKFKTIKEILNTEKNENELKQILGKKYEKFKQIIT